MPREPRGMLRTFEKHRPRLDTSVTLNPLFSSPEGPPAIPVPAVPRPAARKAQPPPHACKPSGEEAIKAWEKQGRRCDGDERTCDQRATREQTLIPTNPQTGEDIGAPYLYKSCSRHARVPIRTWAARSVGFKMLGKTPDPATGKMVDGIYALGVDTVGS